MEKKLPSSGIGAILVRVCVCVSGTCGPTWHTHIHIHTHPHTVMSLQVPSPPGDEDEDFILVHHSDVQLSDKAEQVYAQLMQILREQYEV